MADIIHQCHLNLTPLVRSPQRLYWCIVCHCRCLINNLLLLSFVSVNWNLNNAEPLMLGVVRHTLLGSFALKLLCQIFLCLSWYLFICFFIDKWHSMKFSMLTLSSKLNEPDKDNSTQTKSWCASHWRQDMQYGLIKCSVNFYRDKYPWMNSVWNFSPNLRAIFSSTFELVLLEANKLTKPKKKWDGI